MYVGFGEFGFIVFIGLVVGVLILCFVIFGKFEYGLLYCWWEFGEVCFVDEYGVFWDLCVDFVVICYVLVSFCF